MVSGFTISSEGECPPIEKLDVIRVGDRVVGINGRDITHLPPKEQMSMLSSSDWPLSLSFDSQLHSDSSSGVGTVEKLPDPVLIEIVNVVLPRPPIGISVRLTPFKSMF